MSDEAFFDAADAFIALANELGQRENASRVSAALLYAAARYNAFYFTQAAQVTGREEIRAYLLQQYRTMLEENLDDFLKGS